MSPCRPTGALAASEPARPSWGSWSAGASALAAVPARGRAAARARCQWNPGSIRRPRQLNRRRTSPRRRRRSSGSGTSGRRVEALTTLTGVHPRATRASQRQSPRQHPSLRRLLARDGDVCCPSRRAACTLPWQSPPVRPICPGWPDSLRRETFDHLVIAAPPSRLQHFCSNRPCRRSAGCRRRIACRTDEPRVGPPGGMERLEEPGSALNTALRTASRSGET